MYYNEMDVDKNIPNIITPSISIITEIAFHKGHPTEPYWGCVFFTSDMIYLYSEN